jgi:cytochrome c oxidase subunit 4
MSIDHDAPTSYKTLLSVLAFLLFMTGITVLASKFDFGILNTAIAVMIASVKAVFVLLYFMHLKHEHPMIKWSFVGTIVTVAIVMTLTFADYAFRGV